MLCACRPRVPKRERHVAVADVNRNPRIENLVSLTGSSQYDRSGHGEPVVAAVRSALHSSHQPRAVRQALPHRKRSDVSPYLLNVAQAFLFRPGLTNIGPSERIGPVCKPNRILFFVIDYNLVIAG